MEPGTRSCPECGAEVPAAARFCVRCTAEIGGALPPPSSGPPRGGLFRVRGIWVTWRDVLAVACFVSAAALLWG